MTVRTVGVEEEYLLVDPDSGRPRAVAHAALAAGSGAQLTAELQREQVESATRPCATLTEVGRELRRARAGAAHGLHVHAGHGLSYATVGAIARMPEVVEVSIGHFLISAALFERLGGAVRRMRAALASP